MLLGSRRAASSKWLGWICQSRTRTSAGQYQVTRILLDVNRAVWLCSGAGGTRHFTSTNCVRGCVWAGTYDLVRRRTQCERRLSYFTCKPKNPVITNRHTGLEPGRVESGRVQTTDLRPTLYISYVVLRWLSAVSNDCFVMQGDLVFVKGLLIKGFEVRDKVRTYLKQVGARHGSGVFMLNDVQGGSKVCH